MSASHLATNIAALRRHLGMNQSQFADAVEAKQPAVSKWESGADEPSPRSIGKIADLAGCTVDQLYDSIWRPGNQATTEPDILPTRNASADDATVDIISLDLSLSMGPGTLIEELVEEEPVKWDIGLLRVITRSPFHMLRQVKGIGDSMEPTLRTGDRVLIDTSEKMLSRMHGIYWIDHMGAHGLKRLRAAGHGRILIMSDNKVGGDTFEVDADELRIHGRAIWFGREL